MSFGPDLPLDDRTFAAALGHGMPASIRDAMPDSWGRAVINHELGFGLEDQLPDVRYMLESGSDRVGAIDFQATATQYVPRSGGGSLTAITEGAVAVEGAEPGPQLARAIRNTLTAAGGSQPKAFVQFDGRSWMAKFQTSYDAQSPLIKAERAALYIAQHAGIAVPHARLVEVDGKGSLALLTERFDREVRADAGAPARRQVLSGLTIAEDYRASGASYPKLVAQLRKLSEHPADVGRELFRRLAFRIAMRIDDDHLRNVGFFWDGSHASFTPAFDLSPDLTSTPIGLTDLGGGTREFTLSALLRQHRHYFLERSESQEIVDRMVQTVLEHRSDAADIAMMVPHEREMLVARTATPALRGSA
jgi:serine/threonine-protein kinase HipA